MNALILYLCFVSSFLLQGTYQHKQQCPAALTPGLLNPEKVAVGGSVTITCNFADVTENAVEVTLQYTSVNHTEPDTGSKIWTTKTVIFDCNGGTINNTDYQGRIARAASCNGGTRFYQWTLSNTKLTDTGCYLCQYQKTGFAGPNDPLSFVKRYTYLYVQAAPGKPTISSTTHTITNNKVTVKKGTSLTLKCSQSESGAEPVNYDWRKDNEASSISTTNELTINSVEVGNAGSYTCKVSNAVGQGTSNAVTIEVVYKPIILEKKVLVYYRPGDKIKELIKVDENPLSENPYCETKGVKVFFVITSTDDTKSTWTLTINEAKNEHNGTWNCMITNSAGSTPFSYIFIGVVPPTLPPKKQDRNPLINTVTIAIPIVVLIITVLIVAIMLVLRRHRIAKNSQPSSSGINNKGFDNNGDDPANPVNDQINQAESMHYENSSVENKKDASNYLNLKAMNHPRMEGKTNPEYVDISVPIQICNENISTKSGPSVEIAHDEYNEIKDSDAEKYEYIGVIDDQQDTEYQEISDAGLKYDIKGHVDLPYPCTNHLNVHDLSSKLQQRKLNKASRICEEYLVDGEMFLSMTKELFKEEPFNATDFEILLFLKIQKELRE